tara:strand:+ start:485 stop:817 length:333 start_codon:yes stop_codon:yes gene_type:complete
MKNVIKLMVNVYANVKAEIKEVFKSVSDLGIYENAWQSKTNDNNIVIGLNAVLDDAEFDKLVALFDKSGVSLKRADLDSRDSQRAMDRMDNIKDMLFISNPANLDDLFAC